MTARASFSVLASISKMTPFTVAPRIPLADFSVEIEPHCLPNLGRHDGHDLLAGYALLGSQKDHHSSGFRQRYAGRAWGLPGL